MNGATAKQIGIDEIPVIDLGPLAAGRHDDIAQVGAAMREAAERIGFFYVRNHGIDAALIAEVESLARRFFARPLAEKLAVKPIDRHRGFLQVGQARMYDKAKVDLKESYIWGVDFAADDADYLAGNRMIGPNRWPATLPEMRPLLNTYLEAAHGCARTLLRALAASLGAPEDSFVRCFDKPVSRASLIYYPPQDPQAGEEQFGVAPHTDYGVITLLHQDDVGGLQVATRKGEWVSVHPIAGTLVINSGDLLGRWTNDRFKSNPHRVVNSSGRERLSIAVFADPDFDTLIEPVVQPGEAPKYGPVTCGDYILGRLDRAFAYRKQT